MAVRTKNILGKRAMAQASGAIVSIFLAIQSAANAATFQVVADTPSLNGFGTFSVADSLLLPDSFVAFDSFSAFSFSIGGNTFGLSNNNFTSTEGILTDASGSPTKFLDNGSGTFIDFVISGMGTITFSETDARGFRYRTPANVDISGNYTIGPLAPVPAPPALFLLGSALAGLAGFNRFKRHS